MVIDDLSINVIMPKAIEIEYCGAWGYKGAALRLQKALTETFPDVQINTHSAQGISGTIEVAWINNGDKNIVWSKNKGDTEANHQTIVANLKSAQWPNQQGKRNHNEGVPWNLWGSPEADLIIPETSHYTY